MSSVIVSFGISFKSSDKIFEGNKDFLTETFTQITDVIAAMLDKIPESERSELIQEFQQLKIFCADELKAYTKNSLSAFHNNYILSMFDKLNKNALRLKKLIMLKEAEILKQQKRCSRMKDSIEAISHVLPVKEQELLHTELAAISEKPLSEQETVLKKLSKKICRAAETAQVTEDEIPVQAALKNIQPKSTVLEDIETFIGDMILLDIPVTEEIQALSEQAHASKLLSKQVLFYEQIKLTAAKLQESLIMTQIYREELNQIAAISQQLELPDNIVSEINVLCDKEIISESEYQILSLKIAGYFAQKLAAEQRIATTDMAEKIHNGLQNLGYTVVDNESLASGEPVFFASNNPDCKVMAKLSSDGELATRVVYETDDTESAAYSSEKSKEFAKKWCSDYDILVKSLQEQGVKLEILVRKEPEETPVTVIKKKYRKETGKKAQSRTTIVGAGS